MQHFQKKPVVIEAIRTPESGLEPSEEPAALVQANGWEGNDDGIVIPTLEGDHLALPGDWIIKGVAGEYYPCKPDIFEATYVAAEVTGMTFSQALDQIKTGKRCARSGWNGKNMFVFLVNGSNFVVNREPLLSILGEGTEVTYRPHIDICQPDGAIGVWQPSMGDVMANDWYVVPAGAELV